MNHQDLLITCLQCPAMSCLVEGNIKRVLPHPWTQNTHTHRHSHTPPDPSSAIYACFFSSWSIKGKVCLELEIEG